MKTLILVIAFTISKFNYVIQDPMAEVKIVGGRNHCSGASKTKYVVNNSSTQHITVEIIELRIYSTKQDSVVREFKQIAPHQKKEIGCAGNSFENDEPVTILFRLRKANYSTP